MLEIDSEPEIFEICPFWNSFYFSVAEVFPLPLAFAFLLLLGAVFLPLPSVALLQLNVLLLVYAAICVPSFSVFWLNSTYQFLPLLLHPHPQFFLPLVSAAVAVGEEDVFPSSSAFYFWAVSLLDRDKL